MALAAPAGAHAAAWALSLRMALAYTATTLLALAAPFPRFLAVMSARAAHRAGSACPSGRLWRPSSTNGIQVKL